MAVDALTVTITQQLGDTLVTSFALFATPVVPLMATVSTVTWSPKIAILMTTCNIFAVVIGFYAIRKRGQGPKVPLPLPSVFTDFGMPELLATTSFGHLLGAGLILGLANAGLL